MDLCKNPRQDQSDAPPKPAQLHRAFTNHKPLPKGETAHVDAFCVSGAGGARDDGHLDARLFLSSPEGPCHPVKSNLPAHSPPSSPHLIAPLIPSPQHKSSDPNYPKEALRLQ